MEQKIDLEKLICSFLEGGLTDEQALEVDKRFGHNRLASTWAIKCNLANALKEQGLEYKDGKLVEINKPSTIKFEPELSEFEDKLGEIVIPTWDIAKGCEECKGDVEDVKKWAKELLDIAHRQFSKEEANNDTYTESELCLMSPYQLCKILEGHSDRIKIGDNYADVANGKKTFRMYKFSRLFGSVGYDIVEFETGKNPYISYHWGLGEDPYIKEDDDECTHIVPDEYRESVIKVLIDGILKRQIKKG